MSSVSLNPEDHIYSSEEGSNIDSSERYTNRSSTKFNLPHRQPFIRSKFDEILGIFYKYIISSSYKTILYVPFLNIFLIILFSLLVIRLSYRFENIYESNKLISSITTNLILYGLSDTLAQTIDMISKRNRLNDNTESLQYNEGDSVGLDDENDILIALESGSLDYNDHEEGDNEIRSRNSSSLSLVDSGLERTDNNSNKVETKSSFKFSRLAGFMVWGLFQAFLQVPWYAILHGAYDDAENKLLSTIERVLTDQICFSPISLYGFFAYSNFILEGNDKEAFKVKIRKIYLQTLIANYSVWPGVQFINFLLIPRRFQIPFSSSVSVFWNTFLSMKNASSSDQL